MPSQAPVEMRRLGGGVAVACLEVVASTCAGSEAATASQILFWETIWPLLEDAEIEFRWLGYDRRVRVFVLVRCAGYDREHTVAEMERLTAQVSRACFGVQRQAWSSSGLQGRRPASLLLSHSTQTSVENWFARRLCSSTTMPTTRFPCRSRCPVLSNLCGDARHATSLLVKDAAVGGVLLSPAAQPGPVVRMGGVVADRARRQSLKTLRESPLCLCQGTDGVISCCDAPIEPGDQGRGRVVTYPPASGDGITCQV